MNINCKLKKCGFRSCAEAVLVRTLMDQHGTLKDDLKNLEYKHDCGRSQSEI